MDRIVVLGHSFSALLVGLVGSLLIFATALIHCFQHFRCTLPETMYENRYKLICLNARYRKSRWSREGRRRNRGNRVNAGWWGKIIASREDNLSIAFYPLGYAVYLSMVLLLFILYLAVASELPSNGKGQDDSRRYCALPLTSPVSFEHGNYTQNALIIYVTFVYLLESFLNYYRWYNAYQCTNFVHDYPFWRILLRFCPYAMIFATAMYARYRFVYWLWTAVVVFHAGYNWYCIRVFTNMLFAQYGIVEESCGVQQFEEMVNPVYKMRKSSFTALSFSCASLTVLSICRETHFVLLLPLLLAVSAFCTAMNFVNSRRAVSFFFEITVKVFLSQCSAWAHKHIPCYDCFVRCCCMPMRLCCLLVYEELCCCGACRSDLELQTGAVIQSQARPRSAPNVSGAIRVPDKSLNEVSNTVVGSVVPPLSAAGSYTIQSGSPLFPKHRQGMDIIVEEDRSKPRAKSKSQRRERKEKSVSRSRDVPLPFKAAPTHLDSQRNRSDEKELLPAGDDSSSRHSDVRGKKNSNSDTKELEETMEAETDPNMVQPPEEEVIIVVKTKEQISTHPPDAAPDRAYGSEPYSPRRQAMDGRDRNRGTVLGRDSSGKIRLDRSGSRESVKSRQPASKSYKDTSEAETTFPDEEGEGADYYIKGPSEIRNHFPNNSSLRTDSKSSFMGRLFSGVSWTSHSSRLEHRRKSRIEQKRLSQNSSRKMSRYHYPRQASSSSSGQSSRRRSSRTLPSVSSLVLGNVNPSAEATTVMLQVLQKQGLASQLSLSSYNTVAKEHKRRQSMISNQTETELVLRGDKHATARESESFPRRKRKGRHKNHASDGDGIQQRFRLKTPKGPSKESRTPGSGAPTITEYSAQTHFTSLKQKDVRRVTPMPDSVHQMRHYNLDPPMPSFRDDSEMEEEKKMTPGDEQADVREDSESLSSTRRSTRRHHNSHRYRTEFKRKTQKAHELLGFQTPG